MTSRRSGSRSESGNDRPAALRASRRVAEREERVPSGDPAALAKTLHEICVPVFASIRKSMGVDGCGALVGRAYTRAQWKHPAARTIRGDTDSDIGLPAILSAIEVHGGAATASAVDAVLSSLHEILGRLIGEDMSKRIIDHDVSPAGDEAGTE